MTGTEIRAIQTLQAPSPGGHYAQAVEYGGLVYTSGELPITPDGIRLTDVPFQVQCRQALANLFAVLTAAGSAPDRVLRVTAYVASVGHWASFNAVYEEMFGAHRPARSVIPVKELHFGLLVEIDAVATLDPPSPR